MGMGFTKKRQLAQNYELRSMWEMYLICRATTMVIYEKPVDKKGKTQIMPIVWPTGFAQLPRKGGIEDQSDRDMRILFAFLQGEREGISRRMQR